MILKNIRLNLHYKVDSYLSCKYSLIYLVEFKHVKFNFIIKRQAYWDILRYDFPKLLSK